MIEVEHEGVSVVQKPSGFRLIVDKLDETVEAMVLRVLDFTQCLDLPMHELDGSWQYRIIHDHGVASIGQTSFDLHTEDGALNFARAIKSIIDRFKPAAS